MRDTNFDCSAHWQVDVQWVSFASHCVHCHMDHWNVVTVNVSCHAFHFKSRATKMDQSDQLTSQSKRNNVTFVWPTQRTLHNCVSTTHVPRVLQCNAPIFGVATCRYSAVVDPEHESWSELGAFWLVWYTSLYSFGRIELLGKPISPQALLIHFESTRELAQFNSLIQNILHDPRSFAVTGLHRTVWHSTRCVALLEKVTQELSASNQNAAPQRLVQKSQFQGFETKLHTNCNTSRLWIISESEAPVTTN